jgi:hypothetical protein
MDCVYTPVKNFDETNKDTVYYIKNANDPPTYEELGTFIERIHEGVSGSYKRITWKFSKKTLRKDLYHNEEEYRNLDSVKIEKYHALFTCNDKTLDISEISITNGKINISLDIEKIKKIKQGGRKSIKRKRNIKRRSRIRRSHKRKVFVPLVTSRKMVSGFHKEP